MKNEKWSEFVNKLTNMRHGDPIKIDGKPRKIIALAHYRTDNLGDSEYLKATFADGSFLLVLLKDQTLMFTEKVLHHIPEIADEQIGVAEELTYNGEKFKLVNKNDYQFVLRWYFGEYADLEGEVRFSDYEPVDGSVALLSLGWLAKTLDRADIFIKEILPSKVEI